MAGRSALEDTLGDWLNGNHQAELEAASNRATDATRLANENEVGMELYRDMWQDSERASAEDRARLEHAMQARDRTINMLLHTCYRLYADHDDEEIGERIDICAHYIEQLRSQATDLFMYECNLQNPSDVMDAAFRESGLESLASMSTEADSENSPIDLTGEPETIDLTMEE